MKEADKYQRQTLKPWMNVAALYVSLSLVFGIFVYSSWSDPGIDLNVYLKAARRFLGAQGLYPVNESMPFKYAPSAAWLFIPFLYFPGKFALFAWNALSLVAFYATVKKLIVFLKLQPVSWPIYVALMAAVVCVLQPISSMFGAGQVELILLFLLTQSALSADMHKDALAGLSLALAVTIKFPCAILVVYFLLQKKYRCLFYAATATALLMVPVFLRYHAAATLQLLHEWQMSLVGTTEVLVLRFDAQGLPTAILDLFFNNGHVPTTFALTMVQGSLMLLFVVAMLWCRPLPRGAFCLCCLAVALLSPTAWVQNFLLALPALWLLFSMPIPNGMKFAFIIPGVLLNGIVHAKILGEALSTRTLFLRPYGLLFLCVWVALLTNSNRLFRSPTYR